MSPGGTRVFGTLRTPSRPAMVAAAVKVVAAVALDHQHRLAQDYAKLS